MSFISKFKEIVSPSEYDEEFDNEVEMEEEEAEQTKKPANGPVAAPKTAAYGSSLELKVVRPNGFSGATEIADYLLSAKTVVLNLEETDKESARRLLDFLGGVAYAIGGTLKRVSNTTFIITPREVNVSGEQLQEAVETEEQESVLF